MTRRRAPLASRIAGRRYDCPVAGCGGNRLHWQAVCASCWARLPQDIRGRIESARAMRAPHLQSAASIAAMAWLAVHSPADAIARVVGERPG
ncbi:MAG: hypothetical protein FJ335_02825 [Sphingomonadales bacterium]|nr:hypothetical protein [Sphingomonadales bacterium]